MSNLSNQLLEQKKILAVVGLGYVGLPLAVAFAKKGVKVIGFDIDEAKITSLQKSVDYTGELSPNDFLLAKANIEYTHNPLSLNQASIIIVGVPTPIDENKTPDLGPLDRASRLIGENMKRGTAVVYESTVYPGVTEEYCIPILQSKSGLSWEKGDFFVGYSPERINPGDKEHTLEKMPKVVSGQNREICEEIAQVYEIVVKPKCHRAESIKVAEAAKVIENTQRDLNIALMNELSIIFSKMGIDTESVLKAAGTKWNFMKFHPGLVGGHCIGVDPYYLTSKAEQLGYHPQVVLAGRRINDGMGVYIAEQTIKQLIAAGKMIRGTKLLVLGLTFKENVPDIRNSKVFDIISELKTFGIEVYTYDPFVKEGATKLSQHLERLDNASEMDGIIMATPHDSLKSVSLSQYRKFCKTNSGKPVFIDVRWVYNKNSATEAGFHYWRP